MKNSMLVIEVAFMMTIACGCGPKGETRTEKLQSASQMVEDTLQEAYRRKPDLEAMVERAQPAPATRWK